MLMHEIQWPSFPAFAASTLWMWPSFYAVGAFIAISGYVLMLPVVRSPDGRFRGGTLDYFRRRARRMLPPFYASLAIYLVISVLIGDSIRWNEVDRAYSVGSLLSHLTLTHNLFPQYRYTINAPSWTVSAEWMLYVLYPVVLLPVWRRWGIPALLAVAAALSLIPLLVGGLGHLHSWYVLIFAAGMSAASLQFHDRGLERRWRAKLPWAWLAWTLIIVFFALCALDILLHPQLTRIFLVGTNRFLVFETLLGLAFLALVMACTGGLPQRRTWTGSVVGALSHPWLARMGTISYSLYLVHWPVLQVTRYIMSLCRLDPLAAVFFAYVFGVSASLAAGYALFWLVERHCLPGHLRTTEAASPSPLASRTWLFAVSVAALAAGLAVAPR